MSVPWRGIVLGANRPVLKMVWNKRFILP